MPPARPAPDELSQAKRNRGFWDLLRDLRKAMGRGPREWADLVRAVAELARARIAIGWLDPARLRLMEQPQDAASGALTPGQAGKVDRIAHAVNVMSLRVPWRSDCLVRALAARRWLAVSGVSSRLHIGARHEEDGTFMAHAWLTAGERLVTGGDASPYAEFVRGG